MLKVFHWYIQYSYYVHSIRLIIITFECIIKMGSSSLYWMCANAIVQSILVWLCCYFVERDLYFLITYGKMVSIAFRCCNNEHALLKWRPKVYQRESYYCWAYWEYIEFGYRTFYLWENSFASLLIKNILRLYTYILCSRRIYII